MEGMPSACWRGASLREARSSRPYPRGAEEGTPRVRLQAEGKALGTTGGFPGPPDCDFAVAVCTTLRTPSCHCKSPNLALPFL